MRLGAIRIVIKIGEITTLSVEDWQLIPDDRQITIETIGGIVVQDFGHIEEGDKFSCTVTIRPEDALTLYKYWNGRERVTVIDESGNAHENLRVVITGYEPIEHFADYYEVELEFWRV